MSTNEDINEIVEELIKINKLTGKTLVNLKVALEYDATPEQEDAIQFLDEEEQPVVKARPKRKPVAEPPQMPPSQPVPPQPPEHKPIMEKLLGKEAEEKVRLRAIRMAELERELAELSK